MNGLPGKNSYLLNGNKGSNGPVSGGTAMQST